MAVKDINNKITKINPKYRFQAEFATVHVNRIKELLNHFSSNSAANSLKENDRKELLKVVNETRVWLEVRGFPFSKLIPLRTRQMIAKQAKSSSNQDYNPNLNMINLAEIAKLQGSADWKERAALLKALYFNLRANLSIKG